MGANAGQASASEHSTLASSSSMGDNALDEALHAIEAGVGATSDLAIESSNTSLTSSAEDPMLDEALEVCSLAAMRAFAFALGVMSGASCISALKECEHSVLSMP